MSLTRVGLTRVSVAPDWSLNTNHTGFIVAAALGFYRAAGLELQLLPYVDQPTAAKRVLAGEALLGLGPQETVVAYADQLTPLLAVAAINAHNPSALAVLADSPICRPRDLDGTRYASYGARFELQVVREMIRADGGEGHIEERVLPKPTVPDALYTAQADCTWVFPAWEGTEAELQGRPLRCFLVRDYGVPDLYTPVLFTDPTRLDQQGNRELLRAFVQATAEGFELATTDPERAVAAVLKMYPELDAELWSLSQPLASTNYRAEQPWGVIDPGVWVTYGRYLQAHGFLTDRRGQPLPEPAWDTLHTAEFLS